MADFPEDLQRAYETFTMLCTHYGVTFAGVGIRQSPLGMFALGNVNERGHKFAQLLREAAQIIDDKTAEGKFETGRLSTGPKVN